MPRCYLITCACLFVCVSPFSSFAVSSGLRLWGQVRDVDGGVPHAVVIVAGRDTIQADGSGNYAFSGLPNGPCQLRVEAPGRTSLRTGLWLRSEAFLQLSLCRPAYLATGFGIDTLRLFQPGTDCGQADLDGDGQVESAGWQPIGAPRPAWDGALSARDAWGDPWPAHVPARVDEVGLVRPVAGLQHLGYPGFFGARNGDAALRGPTGEGPGDDVIWLGGGGQARREGGLQLQRGLGLWHRLGLAASTGKGGSAAPHAGRSQSDDRLELSHVWLAASRLTLDQHLAWSRARREDVNTDLPLLHLPLGSAERWLDGRADTRELSWQGRAAWAPSFTHRSEVLVWHRRRGLAGAGLEEDRILNRLLPQAGVVAGDRHLFSTRRRDDRRSAGLRAALDQRHDRGLLQAGLELERQHRRLRASMGADSLLPVGRADWLEYEEEATDLAASLRDVWFWTPRLSIEGALVLRYGYYDLMRLHRGLFQRSSVPDLAFNQDLLSLEPRFALRLRGEVGQLEVHWHQRTMLSTPQGWWDPGRSPESLVDQPLVVGVGSSGELEGLLPARGVDQAGLWCLRQGTRLDARLGVWGRRLANLPLAAWTKPGHSLDPGQLTRAMDARQGGLDLRLDWRGHPLRLGLQGSWRRAWLDGLAWEAVGDTGLWIGRVRHLSRLPGVPDWAWRVDGSCALLAGGLSLEPSLVLRWQGARDVENGAGWRRQLPALLHLDANLGLGWAGLPTWSLVCWTRNLLDDDAPEAAWLARDPLTGAVSWRELAGVGRVAGLRLAWRPSW